MKTYIFKEVEKLKKRYKTSDPFELLRSMHIQIWDAPAGSKMKGFCFLANKTYYVSINRELDFQMQRIVAAHELGHIILHKNNLKIAMMTDYNMDDIQKDTEYEANLFAAELLLEDQDVIDGISEDEGSYYALCSRLDITPSMMSFKLFSMCSRGHSFNLPLGIDSRCLGRK